MSRYSGSKTSLLKDNSWIRNRNEEDDDVDRDPNYGKSVLSHHKTYDTPDSPEAEVKPARPKSTSTSVRDLTKRFSGSQDDLGSSTPPSSKTSSYTKSSYSSLKSDSPTTTTTTSVTKNGTTETTITTTTQTLKSPVVSSPTKFTERVKSSSKGPQYSTYTPTRTTKVTETTVPSKTNVEDKLFDTFLPTTVSDDLSPTDSKKTFTTTETVTVKTSPDTNVEDTLYDTLIPSSIRDDLSPTDSKTTISSTETVTLRSTSNGDGIKTTTTTRTYSTPEDDLYDTLLPKGITSPVSSSIKKREIVTVESSRGGESPTLPSPTSTRLSTSDDYTSDRKTYSYSRPDSSYEYSSITSPTTYTTTSYRSSSYSDDNVADPIYSKSSIKSVYASSERTVLEKDLCTYCRKPLNGGAKMILDDLKVNCHASCFKCEACCSTLGHMKAGDSLWIYKSMVFCENCFEVTREKWRR